MVEQKEAEKLIALIYSAHGLLDCYFMNQKGTIYNLILSVGHQINNLQDDFQTIFRSFVLPCWLARQYSIRIVTSSLRSAGARVHHIITTPNKQARKLQVSLFYFETAFVLQTHTIVYYIQTDLVPFRQINKVTVTFSKDYQLKFMNIRVHDEESFLERNFMMSDDEKYLKIERMLRKGELVYPYIEPEDERTKEEPDINHFHLAFQGGGSKGIAYLGAYKALRELHPDYQIKSVIGSSAGGMISLGIAVGATPNELFETCKRMQQIPLDRTVKSIDQLTPQKKLQYKQIKQKIRKALHDYGFVCNEMFDLLVNEVLTDDIIEKTFQILGANNESVREMLTMETQQRDQQRGCCYKRNAVNQARRVNKIINFYGLLEGKLLTGRELESISLSLIKRFLQDRLKDSQERLVKIMGLEEKNLIDIMSEIDKLSERLTMRQFYELNGGLEFTVTSVDLQSQLLRFFNHKTTPDLPVSKAILMTGSFPIAFESLAWKKQWGKYRIHYRHYRRQIDLTGHNFTDGGMLANFPIIFLDNEDMRPMYFSHKPNDKTRLFGFGLEQITEEPSVEAKKKEQQTLQRLQGELAQRISKHLPIFKLLYCQMKHIPPPEVVPTQNLIPIDSVPIIGFLFKLLGTYIYANDNLVCECFQRDIYFLPGHYAMAESLKIIKEDERDRQLKGLRDALTNIFNNIDKFEYSPISFIENVRDNIKSLQEGGSVRDIIQIKTFIKNTLEQYSLHTQNLNFRGQPEEKPIIENMSKNSTTILENLKKIGRFNQLLYCDTTVQDREHAIEVCQKVIQLFDYNKFACSRQAQLGVQAHLQKFSKIMKIKELQTVKILIKIIHSKLLKKRPSYVEKEKQKLQEGQIQKMDINDSDLTKLLSQYYHSYQKPSNRELFKVYQQRLAATNDWILRQQLVFSQERKSIGNYVQNALRRRSSNNIHLVFQSIGDYNKISFEIFKLVNEYIFIEQNTKSAELADKITLMILGEYNQANPNLTVQTLIESVVIKSQILNYVESNLKTIHQNERVELGDVRIELSPDIRQNIGNLIKERNENMCRLTSITCSSMHSYLGFLMTTGFKQQRIERQLQDMKFCFSTDVKQISKDFDKKDWLLPFKCKIRQLQNVLWDTRYDLFEQLETATKNRKLSTSLETIRMEFENSKEIIMNSYSDILEYLMASQMKASHQKSFEDFLASRMALRLEDNDYSKQNKQISSDTREIMDIIFTHFYEQVRFMVSDISPDSLKEFLMNQQDPANRQVMLKGFIISKFLNCDKLKKRIQQILKELNLPKDIKLKDFNEVIPRKIELTFTAVDTTNKKISFINHRTFPEMPVWAAIVIGSSFPVLFPEVRSLPDWVQLIDSDSEKRFLKLFFDDGKYRRPPIFTSGNLLSSFPLELLSNKKIRQICFAGQEFTFLNFGVNRQKYRNQPMLKQFHRKFITVGEILSIGIKKFTKAMFGMREMVELNTSLMTKNSMLETYMLSHDNLILELYYKELLRLPVRLGTLQFYKLGKKVEGQELTVAQKTVEETFYATKQKFSDEKITYLEMKLNRTKMRVRFLSKERSNKDIKRNYKIQYRLRSLQEWEPVRDQEIYFDNRQAELFLKFYFVELKDINEPYHPLLQSAFRTVSIKQLQFSIDLTTFFSVYNEYCGIVQLPYDKVFKKQLKVVQPPSKHVLRNIQRRAQAEFIFQCRTIVNLFKTGLYCHLCCEPLKLNPPDTQTEQCYGCDNEKMVRFECSDKCGVVYCFKCAKSHSILRTTTKLLCFKRHQFKFLHRKRMLLANIKITPTRCDICLGFTESYYADKQCDIKICQYCCAEFTME